MAFGRRVATLAILVLVISLQSGMAKPTPTRGHIVVFDIGGTFIKAARFSAAGRKLAALRVRTPAKASPDALIDRLRALLSEVRGQRPLAAVAVGFPAPVKRGYVVGPGGMDPTTWGSHGRGIPLERRLRQSFGVP